MFELTAVTKFFGDKIILDGFSHTFAEGEATCLFGPSGSGKTTLLRVAAGLLAPDVGSVSVPADRAAYVFQEDRLFPWFDALGNLTAVGIAEGAAAQALDAVGLCGDAHTLPEDMSGGMQRRLAIARALAYGGDVFFLDEPLRGLDAATAEPVLDALASAIRGKTALLITHDPYEAFRLSDSVVALGGPPIVAIKRARTKEFQSAEALKEWLACG